MVAYGSCCEKPKSRMLSRCCWVVVICDRSQEVLQHQKVWFHLDDFRECTCYTPTKRLDTDAVRRTHPCGAFVSLTSQATVGSRLSIVSYSLTRYSPALSSTHRIHKLMSFCSHIEMKIFKFTLGSTFVYFNLGKSKLPQTVLFVSSCELRRATTRVVSFFWEVSNHDGTSDGLLCGLYRQLF